VHHLVLPKPDLYRLDNGIPVYILDFPGQEILKIEAVFKAGRPEEVKRMASRATGRLIQEGTNNRTGETIAELIDFYGATFSVPSNLDTAAFMLFSLRKYAHELIPVFSELLREPVFPETELETFKRTSMQELQVDLEKVDVLAYRKVTELIFGEQHPYGYNSTPDDYINLTRDDLIAHYQSWYTPSNCLLFASGRVDSTVLNLLNEHFGQHNPQGKKAAYTSQVPVQKPGKVIVPHPGSLQTAIKIGRRTFSRHHPDNNGFFVLNTILGGYFGSRLMMNIREKKGYTYNIYSSNDTYLHDGCFYIATEVNSDKAAATIKEIWKEIKSLRTKPVGESELEMVRNYLLGMLLNGLDGPINTSDVVKGLIVENLPLETFDQLAETIRTITPAQLLDLANRYLQEEDFWTVVVG
jgi:predicted Zn-dependent peptidase